MKHVTAHNYIIAPSKIKKSDYAMKGNHKKGSATKTPKHEKFFKNGLKELFI